MKDSANDKTQAKPKGNAGMLVLLLIILTPALLLGTLAGTGGASILGGFIAMFTLLSTMGGPLRSDLLRLSFLGPLVAFSAVAPRLLAEVSIPGAFALITMLIFVAGLMPLRSRRYDSVALGLGMGTLLGYAMPVSGSVQNGQFVVAALVGLGLALVLRVLAGLADPSGPTRKVVGGLLDQTHADFTIAFDTWLSDRPTKWLAEVLTSAGRYRLARRILASQPLEREPELTAFLERMDVSATNVADGVRSKASPPVTPIEPPPAFGNPAARQAAQAMVADLVRAQRSAQERDLAKIPLPRGFAGRVRNAAIQAGLANGSVQVLHALRTSMAILVALLVSLLLPAGDPLLPTLLATTFGIMQISWRATLQKTLDRMLGLFAGGVLVVLVILFLPPVALPVASLVGLAVGIWYITARPAVGTAGMLLMSVGLNSQMQHLDPLAVVVEYVALGAVALVIGGGLGFLVIPAWKPSPLAQRVDSAVSSTIDALRAIAGLPSPVQAPEVLKLLGKAQAAAQQLVPDHDNLTPGQVQDLERVRSSLGDLLVGTMFVLTNRTPDTSRTLREAAAMLAGKKTPELSALSVPPDEVIFLLAAEARRKSLGFHP